MSIMNSQRRYPSSKCARAYRSMTQADRAVVRRDEAVLTGAAGGALGLSQGVVVAVGA
jgi:hypothetical protein